MILLNVRVHWVSAGAPAFINESIPIVETAEYTMTMLDFIRREIVNVCPNIKYDDSDIKSIKSHSGMNKLRIANFPMSMFFESIQGEAIKELNVVLNRTCGIAQSSKSPATMTMMDKLRAASTPIIKKYKSEWSVDNVKKFLDGYYTASNKSRYLSSLTIKEKPDIYQQIEAIVVKFLNENNLVYKAGAGGEDKALDAVSKLVRLLSYVSQNSATLKRDRLQLYKRSILVSRTGKCIQAKANPGKPEPIKQGKLCSQIEAANDCLFAWPDSYSYKRDNIVIGKPIYDEIKKIREILNKHFQGLVKQDARNIKNALKSACEGPTRFNTTTEIIHQRR